MMEVQIRASNPVKCRFDLGFGSAKFIFVGSVSVQLQRRKKIVLDSVLAHHYQTLEIYVRKRFKCQRSRLGLGSRITAIYN